ncbi:MAG: translation elongation factor 4 [Candidatus Gracilibacteria bacterium]
MDLSKIRNFCIIAHIDHGKSTLADRLIEITHTLEKRDMKHGQILDTMDLEQERGITIKLQPVRMEYEFSLAGKPVEKYILNLIDTPGHVDFSYEVSRSLAAVEGAILIVDATQGIEAQTLSNTYMALNHNLEIVPVLNKIDLPNAEIERRMREIEDALGIPKEEIIPVSAKDGTNIEAVLKRIIERVPPPKAPLTDELKALIFDSVYDSYKGVVAYVRLMSGGVKTGDTLYLLNNGRKVEALEVGYFKPKYKPVDELKDGEIGYIVTGLKEVADARVGDTIWQSRGSKVEIVNAKPLPGYHVVQPYVFASIFCSDGQDYNFLRDALGKLKLNDSSLSYEPEHSSALGSGFRCGFLGLLHLDIVQERLEREYDLDLVVTAPSVSYIIVVHKQGELLISSPSAYPDPATVDAVKEPYVFLEILVPKEYVGAVMDLCQKKRGVNTDIQYLDQSRVILKFDMPLASIVIDFYDNLKSITSGYGSMNYEFTGYKESDLVKLDMLIAGKIVDAFSAIVHRSEAQYVGRDMSKKLKKLIPRANFEIVIQAAIGGKIIARESISPFRKDVTAKLYGGDRTRKDKLLKKQKAGKKRMKMVGNVNIPQDAFLAVLKKDGVFGHLGLTYGAVMGLNCSLYTI